MSATDLAQLKADDVAWELESLLDTAGPEGVDELIDSAEQVVAALEAERGSVADFDAERLASFMEGLGEVLELVGRAGAYAALSFSTDTTDPERGALMQHVEERGTALQTRLLFFELEWAQLDDARVEELLAHDRIDFARHHLRALRRYRPHLLSEPEEKILTEKRVTGSSAWSRLFEELTSTIEVTLSGDSTSLESALSTLAAPEAEVRRNAAEAITEALEPGLRTRAFVFNTLLGDKSIDDRLRSYDSWIASRNLDNEASDESVRALVEAVQGRYDIPHRWYALKARLLGVERIADYDRMAPVVDADPRFEFGTAVEVVLDSYASFSPELAKAAERFVTEGWIDAPVRSGKRPGAFCAYTVPSHHPYVFLNWTSRRRDVLTLAHELGHGLHAYLSRSQGVFHQHTPLTLAETASVFGETVTFGRLLEATTDPSDRLALAAESLEGQIATVFRQVAMNRFEDAVHTSRREDGELSVTRFGDIWESTQREVLGDAVEVTDGYRSWWSYVPHFIGTPGYVYAYAYGQLLALSVYAQYESRGADFVPSYLDLLSSGGSAPPEELGRIVGVDLSDPGFWDRGLDIVERQLAATEDAAAQAGRI